ncbi:hypothetical protein DL96DRAFT_1717491 [Flagelloscypha sp. PMI_526]|nr:hypothetical protein DL96DRAFT_1717491 [Flagelloscypha sp. PMI_526]
MKDIDIRSGGGLWHGYASEGQLLFTRLGDETFGAASQWRASLTGGASSFDYEQPYPLSSTLYKTRVLTGVEPTELSSSLSSPSMTNAAFPSRPRHTARDMVACQDTAALSRMINATLDTTPLDLFLTSPESRALANIYRSIFDGSTSNSTPELPSDALEILNRVALETRAAVIDHAAQLKISKHIMEASIEDSMLLRQQIQESGIFAKHDEWRAKLQAKYNFDVIEASRAFEKEGYEQHETFPKVIEALRHINEKEPALLTSYEKVMDRIRSGWLKGKDNEA